MHGGETIDLTSLTNELTCGLRTACTDADRSAQTVDRPWGANNPQWRPFLHAPLPLSTLPRHLDPYVIVWVGDDGRETDGSCEPLLAWSRSSLTDSDCILCLAGPALAIDAFEALEMLRRFFLVFEEVPGKS